MNGGRSKWPSVGFVAFVLTYVLAGAFFLWGLSTPPLDRVWTLHHLLKIGSMDQLAQDDRVLLSEAMKRHKPLTRALLDGAPIGIISAHVDGWITTPNAVILRTAEAKGYDKLQLDVQTPQDLLPLTINVQGSSSWDREITVERQGPASLELPGSPGRPEIFELSVRGKGLAADPSVLGIRVRFPQADPRGAS